MAADASTNSARITGKVQGKDILLYGRLSKEEIRDKVWWWQPAGEREEHGHEYDDSQEDVIATLGGYYEVPGDPDSSDADELVDLVYSELRPDE
ncbi:hypothetical protein ABZ858_26705 [Streptomyces sp. NPDC047017]|uniref:hypothetical protein n=1 Tax=Streptomyces sp. NPDC047017 TaxID=3155024 RepID=UPI0033DB3212